MKQFYVLVFFSLLVVASAQGRDTTELYSIGGFAGYNLNFHSADFQRLPGVPGNSPGFTTGTGGGFTVGGLFEYPLSHILHLQLRASYGALSGTMKTQENPGNQLGFNNPDGVSVTDIIIEHRMKGILEALFIEPAVSYSLGKNFSLQAGPSVGFMLSNKFEQEEVILQPPSITFLNNRTIMNDTSGSMPGAASTYLSAFIGASYELTAGKKSTIIPSVRYYLPFGDVGSVPWKVSTLQFSAALRTAIIPSVPLPIIRDTVYIRDTTTNVIAGSNQRSLKMVESGESFQELKEREAIIQRTTIHEQYLLEVPRDFALSSTISATGIGVDGQRIASPTVTIEETEIEETFPLLPYVFFQQGDATLQNTRTHVLLAQQTQEFRINELSSDALSIYTHNLNIIGQRMKNAPKAVLTITGCTNDIGDEKNNTTLAKNRALAVRDYLVNVWHVRPEQLVVRNQGLPGKPANNDVEDGQEENRRVEISSTDHSILQPVSIREISKAAVPPTVLFTPSVQAEGEIASWQITLRQGNRTLREYKGNATAEAQRWDVMEYPIPQNEEPITATLFATDKSGQRTEAMQTVPVRQLTINKKRVEIKDDKRIEIFSLILFDFGKSELSALNRTIMAEVQQRIEENSTVAVYGYADRTGTAEYNRDLAQRRCDEVAEFLRGTVPDNRLSVFPVGSDRLLYDNDLPEGRSYSRTVQIVIETPVR